jgi:riboflavin synthase
VDGTGVVEALGRRAQFAELRVRAPQDLAVYLVAKGSVAVDGVSLTIASMEEAAFVVAVIPETLARTTLGDLKAGDRVNIETDMLGKYVVRYLALMVGGGKREGLTVEKLREAGF